MVYIIVYVGSSFVVSFSVWKSDFVGDFGGRWGGRKGAFWNSHPNARKLTRWNRVLSVPTEEREVKSKIPQPILLLHFCSIAVCNLQHWENSSAAFIRIIKHRNNESRVVSHAAGLEYHDDFGRKDERGGGGGVRDNHPFATVAGPLCDLAERHGAAQHYD